MPSLCQNFDFNACLFVYYYFGFSASYFLEMIMPFKYVGNLTQLRMGVASLTFPDMGP